MYITSEDQNPFLPLPRGEVVRYSNLWRNEGRVYLPTATFLSICKADMLQIIPFDLINQEKYCSWELYMKCDTRFPGILYKEDDRYLIIDGNHRLARMIDAGLQTGLFFVLNKDDVDRLTNNRDSLFN